MTLENSNAGDLARMRMIDDFSDAKVQDLAVVAPLAEGFGRSKMLPLERFPLSSTISSVLLLDLIHLSRSS